jgi:hypothetical protein
MQQSVVKLYYFVVQTLLNVFRALLCPSSGALQTAVVASGFRMYVQVDVFSAVVGLLANRPPSLPHSYGNQRLQRQFDGLLMMDMVMPETCWAVSIRQSNKFYDWSLHLVGCFYLSDWGCTEPQILNTCRCLELSIDVRSLFECVSAVGTNKRSLTFWHGICEQLIFTAFF